MKRHFHGSLKSSIRSPRLCCRNPHQGPPFLFPAEELGKLAVDATGARVGVGGETQSQQQADDKTYASLDVVTLKPIAHLQGNQTVQLPKKYYRP